MPAAAFSTLTARPNSRTCVSSGRRAVQAKATGENIVSRRDTICGTAITLAMLMQQPALAAAPAKVPGPMISSLCDEECLASFPDRVTLPSGLQYVDIKLGTGATPVPGFQVTVNYVAMNADGKAFDNSIEKGFPYDIRFGASSVIPGLDEGLKTMRSGGIRRLYIPGNLSFPKGLPSGPGRPRILPESPVIFDVQLLLVPGYDDDE